METKKEIRHKIIRLRKEMDPLVWQQATNDITERVINHPRFLEETDIYCYANYNGEVGNLFHHGGGLEARKKCVVSEN